MKRWSSGRWSASCSTGSNASGNDHFQTGTEERPRSSGPAGPAARFPDTATATGQACPSRRRWTMTAYVLAVLAAEDTDAALFAAKGLVGGGPAAEYLVWRREPCPRTGCGRCSPMSCAALWRGDRRPEGSLTGDAQRQRK